MKKVLRDKIDTIEELIDALDEETLLLMERQDSYEVCFKEQEARITKLEKALNERV